MSQCHLLHAVAVRPVAVGTAATCYASWFMHLTRQPDTAVSATFRCLLLDKGKMFMF